GHVRDRGEVTGEQAFVHREQRRRLDGAIFELEYIRQYGQGRLARFRVQVDRSEHGCFLLERRYTKYNLIFLLAYKMELMRPLPPEALLSLDVEYMRLVPADGMAEWIEQTFIRPGAPLYNEQHAHLEDADIVYLWAAGPMRKQGQAIVG